MEFSPTCPITEAATLMINLDLCLNLPHQLLNIFIFIHMYYIYI